MAGVRDYQQEWDKLKAIHGEAAAAQMFVHPYNLQRPWDYVFGAVLGKMEREWWFEEFELPVLSIVGLHKIDISFTGRRRSSWGAAIATGKAGSACGRSQRLLCDTSSSI